MKNVLKKVILGKMTAVYLTDEKKHVELMVYPTEKEKQIVWDKPGKIDSLIQCCFEDDALEGGFSAGHTMRNSSSTMSFLLKDCVVEENADRITVVTLLDNQNGQTARHILTYNKQDEGITVRTEIENNGTEEIVLKMLSSFSLGMITPFENMESLCQLKYYRIRSKWSAEGKVECGSIEDLQLEPSWARHGVAVERFGQVGSMPVRKFFPFAAIEDTKNNVVWAVQLACGCSWQMEFYRRDENLCISGGLADYDFGHWKKVLKPGERFKTPQAYITVVENKNDNIFDKACQNLTNMHNRSMLFYGKDKKLPSVFNEYCTTWGKPSQENIEGIIETIKNKDFDYFIIDAGWYADESGKWEGNMGDWNVSRELFPDGLEKTIEKIRNAGLKPGIWFEVETVGKFAKALGQKEHLLKRDGHIIQSGERFFWDMRDPWVIEYLTQKVIHFLIKYGFEYIKIDYNESIGLGCDGSDSYGQGLFENTIAVQKFYDAIHEAIPSLAIELCSSGGHRLEPSFLNCTDAASFSDAHEELEIPVIAANVHRVMRPEKSQIWSVIRKDDSLKRICYSVTSTFLGMLCISGDVMELSEEQWDLIDSGISFYRKLDNIIKDGRTYYYGTKQASYRNLNRSQGILRKTTKKQ